MKVMKKISIKLLFFVGFYGVLISQISLTKDEVNVQIARKNCHKLIHQMEDDIHALRMNIKNYGVSQHSLQTIDRFDKEIKQLCEENKCCNHSLAWKLDHVRKMAEAQIKRNKKNTKSRVYGGGAPLLLPVLTIGAPASIIGTEG